MLGILEKILMPGDMAECRCLNIGVRGTLNPLNGEVCEPCLP